MAGFVVNAAVPGGHYEFHTDTHNVQQRIRDAAGKRVVTLQLDGDELEAALWGIGHWSTRREIAHEIAVQQQLQYQNVQCPNCFQNEPVVEEILSPGEPDEGSTHICHKCGQTWFHEDPS